MDQQHWSPKGMAGPGLHLIPWAQGGHGVGRAGSHLAVVAAVAVGTLGPLLERAVVSVAAGVGAFLCGERTTPWAVLPSLPQCCPLPLLHPSQHCPSHPASGETEARRG